MMMMMKMRIILNVIKNVDQLVIRILIDDVIQNLQPPNHGNLHKNIKNL